jgi:hypothetical protein
MAYYTRKDFGSLFAINPGDLSNYIKRGKIVLSGDLIDDSIQINKEFIANRLLKLNRGKVETDDGVPNIQTPELGGSSPLITSPDDLLAKEKYHELQKKKIIAEIAQKESATRLNQFKIDKQKGELMPTDMVKIIFTQHTKSIVEEFKNAVDGILTKFSKRRDLDNAEVAEIRGELIKVINSATENAVKTSKKNIQNIISEYSETKEVGEHS